MTVRLGSFQLACYPTLAFHTIFLLSAVLVLLAFFSYVDMTRLIFSPMIWRN